MLDPYGDGAASTASRGSLDGSGSGVTGANTMGADHYGPGHAGAKVLHRCDHCGNDNDISRYFRKEAVYRMS
ncbi:hypothetical protein F4780DRAFT_733994 [Xylariomycetidae sp. FL0641]|nr:hypothetical protein F4780DRAFT_733994 [Xylariomycetidae sp. FL0641]